MKIVRCCVCGMWAWAVEIVYDPCYEQFFCTACFEPEYCECNDYDGDAA